MQANKKVTINGRQYDSVTGLPVDEPSTNRPAAKTATPRDSAKVAASKVHTTTQRSQTLHRRATKKPGPTKRPQPGQHMDIARSNKVTRFAKHPQAAAKPSRPVTADIAPKPHPIVRRAAAKAPAKTPVVSAAPSSKAIKQAAVNKALATPTPKKKDITPKKRFQWTRRFTIITALFAVLLAGAIITYVNLPTLSVAVAAQQAGVEATYPKFVPDGYSLAQPVTYSDGEIVLNFRSNAGTGEYSITQTRSSWDSSAVLDNVVREASGDNYIATQERGLTIYSYEDSAAWVNGGVLYVIESSARLSGDQIRRIATSL